MDFFHRLDREKEEDYLQAILNQRKHHDLEKNFNQKDPELTGFLKILHVSK